MIDIEKTLSLRGYDPVMLTSGSNKKVWAICNRCKRGRWVVYQRYSDLCRSCSMSKIPKPEFVCEPDRFILNTGIDRIKTIEEKDYDPTDLKSGSNKKVWSVCLGCGEGRWLAMNDYIDLCHPCSVKFKLRTAKLGDVKEEDRFIPGTYIDRIKTIEEKGYDPINLKSESNMKVWAVCNRCGIGRWLPYQQYHDSCHKCCKMLPEPEFVSGEDRFISGTGIDRIKTIEEMGYDPIDLKSQAQRKVWCVCLKCGGGRWLSRVDYHDLCFNCVQGIPPKAKLIPEEKDRFISGTGIDRITTIWETGYDPIDLASRSNKKIWCVCQKCGDGRWLSMDGYYDLCGTCGNARSGEDNPNWQGGISYDPYCPKFNDKLKRQIRDQYNNCDFMSGLPDYICNVMENGKVRKLDVHHVDMNKNQGCDGIKWKLVPLSRRNHMKTNGSISFWEKLIRYALKYDESYYNNEIKDIFCN